jgi:hypothetical protein
MEHLPSKSRGYQRGVGGATCSSRAARHSQVRREEADTARRAASLLTIAFGESLAGPQLGELVGLDVGDVYNGNALRSLAIVAQIVKTKPRRVKTAIRRVSASVATSTKCMIALLGLQRSPEMTRVCSREMDHHVPVEGIAARETSDRDGDSP